MIITHTKKKEYNLLSNNICLTKNALLKYTLETAIYTCFLKQTHGSTPGHRCVYVKNRIRLHLNWFGIVAKYI